MKVLPASTFLLFTFVTLCTARRLFGPDQQEIDIYRDKIRIVHELLDTRCPTYSEVKRETDDDLLNASLEVEKKYYDQLLNHLIKCQGSNTSKTLCIYSYLYFHLIS